MTFEWLQRLIHPGESETLELKSSTGQRTAAAKTVCGMLNAKGGYILFGVMPDGTPAGQEVSESTLRALSGELARIEPAPLIEVETVPVPNTQRAVIVVEVPGRTGLFTFDGRPYVRRNSTTSIMPPHQYELRVAEKLHGNIRWENQQAVDIGIEDLDVEEIERCVRAGQRIRRLPENTGTDPLSVLQHFRLADMEGAILNGAVALFVRRDRLTARHMQLGIRLARFRGTENTANFSDNRQAEGSVFELLRRAEQFLMDHVPIASEVGTGAMVRTDISAYPPGATREALANALCHRNYATAGETVGVAMFDDRLEISSPGGLKFGITIEDLQAPHPSMPWNPLMANVLYRAGIIEQWGTGTTRIADICQENGNPPPTWVERAGTLVVIFRPVADRAAPQVAEDVGTKPAPSRHQVEMMRKCRQGQSLVNLMAVSGRSDRTKFRNQVLNPLIDNGLVEMTIPGKPQSSNQKYRLTAKGRDLLASLPKNQP